MNNDAGASLVGITARRGSALWNSAFRPFFLLGAAYGPLLMVYSIGIAAGLWPVPVRGLSLYAWHGHEIIFGFSVAVIVGIVLTALPSWARTNEIDGVRLQWLVGLWLAGRVGLLLPLPVVLVAALDCSLYLLLVWLLIPQLMQVANRYYWILLLVLASLFAANVAFYVGVGSGSGYLSTFGLRLAVYAIIFLFVMKTGVFTPVFTGNALREKQRGEQAVFLPWLDILAALTVIALAIVDLAEFSPAYVGIFAIVAGIVHLVRLARWRGWRVADEPLLLVMHLGYVWLVVAFALKAWAEVSGGIGEETWLHAFTTGALSMTMIGMLVRVSLRHTGRRLRVPPLLLIALFAIFAAALLRIAIALNTLDAKWLAVSALLWSAAFLLFLIRCGRMLWQPSLPAGRRNP